MLITNKVSLFDLIQSDAALRQHSNMREPAQDNLAFEMEIEGTGTKPGPLWIESKKGFGERRPTQLTESVMRDQHLAYVSWAYLKSLLCCDLPFLANHNKLNAASSFLKPLTHLFYLDQVREVIEGASEGGDSLTRGQIEVFILLLLTFTTDMISAGFAQ